VGVREAKDLILRVKVDAIIGTVSSAVALAVIEVTREYKTLYLNHISSTEKLSLERIHPYYFQLFSNTFNEAGAVGKYTVERKDVKTFVTVAADYEWGHSAVEIAESVIAKERPDIKRMKNYWPKLGEVDYTSYVSAILSEKPDICLTWLGGADFMNFIKQGKAYGLFDKVPLVTIIHEDDLREMGPEFPEKIIMWSRAPYYGINNPKHNAFQKKFEERTGYPAAHYAIHTYDGVMILAEAIKRAKSFDKDAIAPQISGGKFDTLRGQLYFRPIDHMLNSPIYYATSVFDKQRGWCIGKDITIIPGESLMRTPEEIKKIRAEKGIVFKPWHEK
jgi:branched-chain amino acid transport system substrate-binding protein